MTFTRTFIKRYASQVLTKNRTVNNIQSTIRREGSRMVDNADFIISGSKDIDIEDYIGYQQDIVDLSNLLGLWNFAGCVRDESGNDVNEENSTHNLTIQNGVDYPIQTSPSKVKGKRSLNFNSEIAGRYLKIPDKRVLTSVGADSDYSIFDFSADFTINIVFTLVNLGGTNTSDPVNKILFDKFNNFTNQGIMIFVQNPQGAAGTEWNLNVKVGDGTTVNTYTWTATDADWEKLTTVCVRRIGDSLKAFVDNVERISQTRTGDFTTRADIYLYKEFNETGTSGQNYTGALVEPASTFRNGGMICTMHQLRIYNRGLSDDELRVLFSANVPTMTLKFYGRIWKVDDKSTNKKVYAKGLGSVALNTRLDPTILSGNVLDGSEIFRENHVYYPTTNTRTSDIVNNILKEISIQFFGSGANNMLYAVMEGKPLEADFGYTTKGKFIAEGTFLDILNDISVLNNWTFTFMPTGICMIEDTTALPQRGGLILSNRNSNVIEGGKDDSFMVNHLYVCGSLNEFTSTQSRPRSHSGNDWSAYTFFLSDFNCDVLPTSISRVDQDGTEIPYSDTPYPNTPSQTSYWYDSITGKLYFYSTTSGSKTYNFTFSYNLNSAIIGENGGSIFGSVSKIQKSPSSITKNGLYARKLSVPRLGEGDSTQTGENDVIKFATNFIEKNKGDSNDEIPLRVTIKTSDFIDHIIENNTIGVYYLTRGIGTTTLGDPDPVYLQIKRIEYNYPSIETIIEVGDFLYDSFDLEKESSEGLRGIQSNQF